MRKGSSRRLAVGVVVAILVAGCQGAESQDKAGTETVVLRLATINGDINFGGQEYGPQAFVDGLEEVSGGQFRIEVVTTFGDGAPDAESKLVNAISEGEIDGGWPSTRAFASAGIGGLEAVEAPLTITSYAAQKALVSGPVADTVLARLDGTGIVGLGLAGGNAAATVRDRGAPSRTGRLARRPFPRVQLAGTGRGGTIPPNGDTDGHCGEQRGRPNSAALELPHGRRRRDPRTVVRDGPYAVLMASLTRTG